MLEKKFQLKFNKWAKYHLFGIVANELKLCKGNSMPFNKVKPHQLFALQQWKKGGLQYKIPDDSILEKPFDHIIINISDFVLVLKHVKAFIVIMFYKHSVKHFYMIDIDVFINEKRISRRKSLTEERAKEICERIGYLK